MTRQDKIEAAAKELIEIGAYSKLSKNIVWKELKEALEPEFVPVENHLYYFWNDDRGYRTTLFTGVLTDDYDVIKFIADDDEGGAWDNCRPLTEQEWIDIGAPIVDAKDE